MKPTNNKYIFTFFLIITIYSCNSTSTKQEQVFETPFPQELFASYFAGSEQGVVFTYVSAIGDTLNFHTAHHDTSFTPYVWNDEWENEEGDIPDSAGWESFYSSSEMNALENGNIQLTWVAACSMRQHIEFLYEIDFGEEEEQYMDGQFVRRTEESTNDIFAALTDTIALSRQSETGEVRPTGKFVRNKGLVWFVDYKGTEWHLIGQSQGNPDGLTDEEKAVLATPFPKEYFNAYFPYEVGDSLAYRSSKKDVLRFCVKDASEDFTPYNDCDNGQDADCKYKEEYFSQRCKLETQGLQFSGLTWTASCSMRSSIYLSYNVSATRNNMMGRFQYEVPYSSNESFSALTDSVYLKYMEEDTKPNGLIVKGKGLLWFLDKSGEKWTLTEVKKNR